MKYILNSAVITNEGTFTYETITVEAAREWLNQNAGEAFSSIGYQETIDAFSLLFCFTPELNKVSIRMYPGDEGLVFRLRSRCSQHVKGRVGVDWIIGHCEVGLLKRIA